VETFTAGDGYRWHYRCYPPVGPERGVVVCVHGIQSHGGWYVYSCSSLARAGYRVYFLDRRGAGMNQQARGDTPSFRRLLADIAEFLCTVRCQTRRPVFLVGISWGGKLAAALWRFHCGLFEGLALVTPGLFARFRPSPRQTVRLLLCRAVAPRRRFDIPLNDPELFTDVPRWRQFIADDPLALHQVTARMVLESNYLDFYLRHKSQWLPVPVLLLLAGRDRIIFNEPTRAYVDFIGLDEKQVIEYPHATHTLEFEEDPDVYIRDLRAWLDRQTQRWTPILELASPAASVPGGNALIDRARRGR
jgi:alpha-beta hydrolase superfamily lysophospholipase